MEPTVHSEASRVLQRLLVDARKAVALRQVEVADRIDEPQAFVSAIERGERRLDVIEFVRYCRAIDADPVVVFSALIATATL